MREIMITGYMAQCFIKDEDVLIGRRNVMEVLGLNGIQAKLWMDKATGSLLQYYVCEKGHPTSKEGYRIMQQIISPHYRTLIRAIDIVLNETS